MDEEIFRLLIISIIKNMDRMDKEVIRSLIISIIKNMSRGEYVRLSVTAVVSTILAFYFGSLFWYKISKFCSSKVFFLFRISTRYGSKFIQKNYLTRRNFNSDIIFEQAIDAVTDAF